MAGVTGSRSAVGPKTAGAAARADTGTTDESQIAFAGHHWSPVTLPLADDLGRPSAKASWDEKTYRKLFLRSVIARLRASSLPMRTAGPVARPGRPADLRRAVFPRDIAFDGSEFPLYADFTGAVFHGDLFIVGEHLALGLDEATFLGEVHIRKATFKGDVSLARARFGKTCVIGDTTFLRDAYFPRAEFHAPTAIASTRFARHANFNAAVFRDVASFRGSNFEGRAYFARTLFSGMTSFEAARFHQFAYFSQAEFPQGASFDRTTFIEPPYFSLELRARQA